MVQFWWIPVIAIVLLGAIYFFVPRRRSSPAVRLTQAKRSFHIQRERLEAKFVQLASAHATPSAPRWDDCTFADDVAYVRNRATGELSAFVAVAVASEESARAASTSESAGSAAESSNAAGGAVGNLQGCTAIFRFDCDHWETDGRAILNLSPAEAIFHDGHDLEIIGEELAHRR
jgi:hypothetical protein